MNSSSCRHSTKIAPMVTLAVALGVIAAALPAFHSVSEASMLPARTHALIAPLAADKGTFKILVSGQQIGKEEFTIAPNGSITSCRLVSSELKNPDLEQKLLARIRTLSFAAEDVETLVTTYPLDFLPS